MSCWACGVIWFLMSATLLGYAMRGENFYTAARVPCIFRMHLPAGRTCVRMGRPPLPHFVRETGVNVRWVAGGSNPEPTD